MEAFFKFATGTLVIISLETSTIILLKPFLKNGWLTTENSYSRRSTRHKWLLRSVWNTEGWGCCLMKRWQWHWTWENLWYCLLQQMVNVLYLYSTFVVIIDYSKCFTLQILHSSIGSYTHGNEHPAGCHLLIRRVNFLHTHTLMAASGAVMGSVSCSRSNQAPSHHWMATLLSEPSHGEDHQNDCDTPVVAATGAESTIIIERLPWKRAGRVWCDTWPRRHTSFFTIPFEWKTAQCPNRDKEAIDLCCVFN